MFHDPLIKNLLRQKKLLSELIEHLEQKEKLEPVDLKRYDATTRIIERRLRKFKSLVLEECHDPLLSKNKQKKH